MLLQSRQLAGGSTDAYATDANTIDTNASDAGQHQHVWRDAISRNCWGTLQVPIHV
jgi:hypothetical protein